MKHYTLMLIGDERSPVRRFQISGSRIKQFAWIVAIVVLVLALGSWDYLRMRVDNRELDGLRVKTAEQTTEMEGVRAAITKMEREMHAVRELERKVRIIANLPGAAAVGGAEVTELAPAVEPGDAVESEPALPAGVPLDIGVIEGSAQPDQRSSLRGSLPTDPSLTSEKAQIMRQLEGEAQDITISAEIQSVNLEDLLSQLENKRNRLVSTPSIWPARGWLTSRFGPRVSPFTNRRQMHAGIDIAAANGTDVISPAHGKVVFAGRKGPLGNAVVVDHGFGVRTLYGHNSELFVEKGANVDRGQVIAAVGSSGRSTGPHLHYVVEVDGKARNPLDYIFD